MPAPQGGIFMDRIEKAEQVKRQLYGEAAVPLKETDPEFAAIKERLVYGEVYTDTGISWEISCGSW